MEKVTIEDVLGKVNKDKKFSMIYGNINVIGWDTF